MDRALFNSILERIEETERLPEIRHDLDDKATNTLSWLVSQVESGSVSPSAARIILDAVFMTVSGLLPKDTVEMFTLASAEFRERARDCYGH